MQKDFYVHELVLVLGVENYCDYRSFCNIFALVEPTFWGKVIHICEFSGCFQIGKFGCKGGTLRITRNLLE